MSKQKKTPSHVPLKRSHIPGTQKKEMNFGFHFGFQKNNYLYLLIGLGLNILGFILMIGGGTDDPNVFNEQALFSPIRLTLSPMLIVGGYIVMIFAIMKKNKPTQITQEESANS